MTKTACGCPAPRTGVTGDLVGDREHDVEMIGGNHIGQGERRRRAIGNIDAARRIGAVVVDQPAAQAEDAGVAIDRDLHVPDLVALLGRGDEMLEPILDPFDRAPASASAASATITSSGIEDEFRPEAAADVGRGDAQPVLVEAEQLRKDSAWRHAASGSSSRH